MREAHIKKNLIFISYLKKYTKFNTNKSLIQSNRNYNLVKIIVSGFLHIKTLIVKIIALK